MDSMKHKEQANRAAGVCRLRSMLSISHKEQDLSCRKITGHQGGVSSRPKLITKMKKNKKNKFSTKLPSIKMIKKYGPDMFAKAYHQSLYKQLELFEEGLKTGKRIAKSGNRMVILLENNG